MSIFSLEDVSSPDTAAALTHIMFLLPLSCTVFVKLFSSGFGEGTSGISVSILSPFTESLYPEPFEASFTVPDTVYSEAFLEEHNQQYNLRFYSL